MVAGGTLPADTVLLAVNPKHAIDAGCSVRDGQKAGNYTDPGPMEMEGEGEAETRRVTGSP